MMKTLAVLWVFLSLDFPAVYGAAVSPDVGEKKPLNAWDIIKDHGLSEEVPPLDHLLAIRDAPGHLPIADTRITPSMLLTHIRGLEPSTVPVAVENSKDFEFHRYTFNASVWNAGLADALSHPPGHLNVKLAALREALDVEHEKSKIRRRSPAKWDLRPNGLDLPIAEERYDQKQHPTPPEVALRVPDRNSGYHTPQHGWNPVWPKMMSRCFGSDHEMWVTYRELKETIEAYCAMFDKNMWQFVTEQGVNDLGEFSLGTIYHGVKMMDDAKYRVNFQFIYQPKAYTGPKYWYPLSMFTGIQGFCNKILSNFVSPTATPKDCQGASGSDTRGGWVGMDAGPEVDNRWVFRWAVDPYSRGSKQRNLPDPYPEDETKNGLPRTDPKNL